MKIAAAGTVHPGASRSGDASDAATVFYGILEYFRETNVEGLRLWKRLEDVINPRPTSCDDGTLRAFSQAVEIIRKEIADARQRALQVEIWRRLDPETTAWYARELTQISNAWDDLEQVWSRIDVHQVPIADLILMSQASIATLDQMVFTCACQTIPEELENYLNNYRIGTALDFVATFRDQLPDEDYTRKVLVWLAPQRGIISGLIDLKNARVIKADHRVWRQMLSVAIVLITALLGFVLIAVALHLGDWLGMAPGTWPIKAGYGRTLSGAYVLVLCGVLGHWILDRVKQSRNGDDATPFSEWLLWIHVNEVPIASRIATVWLMIALGIGVHMYDLSKAIQPVTYFTAGYFLDSTFDALVGRFNTFISSQYPDKKKAKA